MKQIKRTESDCIPHSGHADLSSFRHVERSETSLNGSTSHCHPEAYPHSCHPEERSDVRFSGQVGTVFESQGPHALQAQDDVSCFRHPEAHPHSRHPEAQSAVRVLGQVDTVFGSRGPHGGKAPSGRRGNDEKGRSMVETLGVLAIMAVLSVAMIAGFHIAVDKSKANTIVQDSRMAFMSAQNHHYPPNGDWEQVEFTPNSGKTTYLRNDWVSRIYVLVEGIEEGVCKQLLRMRTKGVLNFYTDDTNTEFTTCTETNDVVLDWNGVAPAECLTYEQCPGANRVCNAQHQCQVCQDFETPNANRTACLCNDGQALSCQLDNIHWCCGPGDICGETAGGCVESDLTCSYRFKETGTMVYHGDCNYVVMEELPEPRYYGDCTYRVDAGTTGRLVHPVKKCTRPNEYCALFWVDENGDATWNATGANVQATSTGFIYGRCEAMTEYVATPLRKQKTEGRLVNKGKGCTRSNEYCALFWVDENGDATWNATSANIQATSTGVIWGRCQAMTEYVARPLNQLDGGTNASVETGCPAGMYCSLKWQPEECTNVTATAYGSIYGVCIDMDANGGSCPYGK